MGFDNTQEKVSNVDKDYMANLYNEVREIVDTSGINPGYNTRTQAEEIYDKFIDTYKHEFPDQSIKNIADGMRSLMKQLRGEYITEKGGYEK